MAENFSTDRGWEDGSGSNASNGEWQGNSRWSFTCCSPLASCGAAQFLMALVCGPGVGDPWTVSPADVSFWSAGCAGLLAAHGKRLGVPKHPVPWQWCRPSPCTALTWITPCHPCGSCRAKETHTTMKRLLLTVPWGSQSFVSDLGDLCLLPVSTKLWQARRKVKSPTTHRF